MTRVRHAAPVLTLLAALTITACGGREVPVQAPPPPPQAAAKPPAPPPPPPPPPAPAPAPLTEEELFAQKTLEQLNAERPLTDVFFDLDQSAIREDGRQALQADAEWLKRWQSTRIVIEGHCDSRGSSEYNLALGARRATAVRDYLVSLGVPANRIEVISKGKEEPFCTQENESCWQQNRRGHLLITAK